ncbi:MAG: YbhB/YbcL family Raf kinase inhibitor-like protein [Kofleriaceae bacterium]
MRTSLAAPRGLASATVWAGLWLAACGGDDTPSLDAGAIDGAIDGPTDGPTVDTPSLDAPIDAPTGAFQLTSPTIVEGGVIPIAHSCRGANTSPALAWTGGPSAPGYAMVFTDITSSPGFLHSVIWDVPGSAIALPANIAKVFMPPEPAGAKQPLGYDGQTRGYLGPCPPAMHTYQFALYAVDVYPLPGLTMQSSRTAVRDAVLAHATASATLTATFTP